MRFLFSFIALVAFLCFPLSVAHAGGIPPTAPPPLPSPMVTPKHIPTLPPSPPPTVAPPTLPPPVIQPPAPVSQQNIQHNTTTNSPNTINSACGINQNGNNNTANCQMQTQQQDNNQNITVNVASVVTVTPTPVTTTPTPIVVQPAPATQQQIMQATVAPPSTPTQLPNTGAGADILFGLFSVLPLGIKLQRLFY